MRYLILSFGFVFMGLTNLNIPNNSAFINDEIGCSISNIEPCTELVQNCRATAVQEYENGNYSEAAFHMFYDAICLNGGLDCVIDVYG